MRILRLLFSVLLLPAVSAGDPIPEEAIPRFGGCYFAQMTAGPLWRMRDQDGAIREFEPHEKRKNVLVGQGGWTAAFDARNRVTVKSPANVEPHIVYHFLQGRLSEAEIDGKRCRFSYPEPLVYEQAHIVPLWPESQMTRQKFVDKMSAKWQFGDRMKFGFASPNQAGAVLAMLVLVCFSVALASQTIWRIHCSLIGASFLVLLAMTASRGAMVSTAVGSILIVICHLKKTGLLSFRRISLFVGIILLVMASVTGLFYASVRTAKSDKASDSIRLELLRAASRMMCDAPCGWGSRLNVGQAYSDWYQPKGVNRRMFSLVNDHLTNVVALGWLRGGLYVFVWFVGLAALWLFAWRGGSSVPLAVWTALGIAATVNVVLHTRFVSWIPFLSLAFLLFDRRWLSWRFWIMPCCIGICGTAVVMGILHYAGNRVRLDVPTLRHEGCGTIVNGKEAQIWVVADEDVLGLNSVKAEIRHFYKQVPSAPAIGYVTDLDSLPREGVRRLVLTGRRGEEFLNRFTAGGIRTLPREIVFLAPQFGSSRIPISLRAKTNVRIVIGEFSARYFEDYTKPSKWIRLVSGAECYIPGWMRFCVQQY